jgi:hypothetical protein
MNTIDQFAMITRRLITDSQSGTIQCYTEAILRDHRLVKRLQDIKNARVAQTSDKHNERIRDGDNQDNLGWLSRSGKAGTTRTHDM